MFAFYGGVPHVTVPDCLKQGVLKCHLYDPDLNPGYAQLGVHFSTAVVPARPGHPKDKAIVEGLGETADALPALPLSAHALHLTRARSTRRSSECIERINDRRHTRFGVSRRERFEALEKAALKPLPHRPSSTAGNGRKRSCMPTVMSASRATTTAPRISTGTRSCGSRSPRTRSRSS